MRLSTFCGLHRDVRNTMKQRRRKKKILKPSEVILLIMFYFHTSTFGQTRTGAIVTDTYLLTNMVMDKFLLINEGSLNINYPHVLVHVWNQNGSSCCFELNRNVDSCWFGLVQKRNIMQDGSCAGLGEPQAWGPLQRRLTRRQEEYNH